jgi:hypothetical protein
MDVAVDVLIEQVYVSPHSPDRISGVIKRELEVYGVCKRVVKLPLYSKDLL